MRRWMRPGSGSSGVGCCRLAMYFVLALWLFRGRNCGYGQVMTKLADGLYHQRRAADLLDGSIWDPDGWVDAGAGGGARRSPRTFPRCPGAAASSARRRSGSCSRRSRDRSVTSRTQGCPARLLGRVHGREQRNENV